MATIKIVTGLCEVELTTDHSASSYGQPVLIKDGLAYGQNDLIDLGNGAVEFLRCPTAAEHVARWAVSHWREFTRLPFAQYNLVANFINLPLAHE